MLNPELGRTYGDKEGRRFTVSAITLGDRLGRDVRGFVIRPRSLNAYTEPAPYSCSAGIFKETWTKVVE